MDLSSSVENVKPSLLDPMLLSEQDMQIAKEGAATA